MRYIDFFYALDKKTDVWRAVDPEMQVGEKNIHLFY